MSDEKMSLWDAVARPPESALSEIKGGRMSGKTDIKPQWRLQVMTEQLGPCGKGWGYEIEKIWTEPGPDGQLFAFVFVHVWIAGFEQTVPGVGGAMLVEKEKNGLHCDDDAFKKALTDGIGVAMRALGVAADIYLGKSDGGTYRQSIPADTGNTKGDDAEFSSNGAAMLAKLHVMTTDALRDKTLTQKQFADAALGLDSYLEKHPGENVGDYTRNVESKLKKKREPVQLSAHDKAMAEANAPDGTTPQPTEDDPVIADAKNKVEMLDGINRTADKAADGELGIF